MAGTAGDKPAAKAAAKAVHPKAGAKAAATAAARAHAQTFSPSAAKGPAVKKSQKVQRGGHVPGLFLAVDLCVALRHTQRQGELRALELSQVVCAACLCSLDSKSAALLNMILWQVGCVDNQSNTIMQLFCSTDRIAAVQDVAFADGGLDGSSSDDSF